ncbi:ogr/Delta-like zinc finger family protein [Paraburkholderia antibiotica]|uniref:Ogr/Delta-like zinc finger family protein n=1 Tax=Paraburkholderia antibiotica TaxID=2728839 RepID=A0A7X9X5K3_9BURK|nr:ogr/Delta-like zinc finger family protein [Paraburkholderia antibiotica]NML31803.1 ogr/Delta-like zinc finger family protein [Paraburkholderia antibiotica]
MRWTMPCPCCGARGIARAMLQTSDLCWTVDFQCDRVTCGHTYRTELTMLPAAPVQRVERRDTLSLFDDLPPGGGALLGE